MEFIETICSFAFKSSKGDSASQTLAKFCKLTSLVAGQNHGAGYGLIMSFMFFFPDELELSQQAFVN